MFGIVKSDKATTVHLQHGVWYKAEPETRSVISASHFWVATLERVHLRGGATAPGSPVRATRPRTSHTKNREVA